MTEPVHVLAGVLLDAAGRVLLAQRPPGKHLAGAWEFPGGKREPGESPLAALQRELFEELAIRDVQGAPLIRVPWRYGERDLLLDAWRLSRWRGVPTSMEGQALQWCDPLHVDPAILTPADRPILQALRLPSRYLVTPVDVAPEQRDAWFVRLRQTIERGGRLLQLRLPRWSPAQVRALATALLPVARRHGAQLLLDADVDGARELGEGVGVQLPGPAVAAWDERPLPWCQPVAIRCRDDAGQLAYAAQRGVDFAVLSPVAAAAGQRGGSPAGWQTFTRVADAVALPVYGMADVVVGESPWASGRGVAGVRG